MMRRLIAVMLSFFCLCASNPAFGSSQPDQTSAERIASLKQQVVRIPAGAVTEVKLHQKGSKKITGRLGSITDEGFEIQTVESGKVSSEKLAFADVESVKEKHGMSLLTKTLIVTLAVVGALALIGGIIAATGVNN